MQDMFLLKVLELGLLLDRLVLLLDDSPPSSFPGVQEGAALPVFSPAHKVDASRLAPTHTHATGAVATAATGAAADLRRRSRSMPTRASQQLLRRVCLCVCVRARVGACACACTRARAAAATDRVAAGAILCVTARQTRRGSRRRHSTRSCVCPCGGAHTPSQRRAHARTHSCEP